jgi:nucleolar complex protein 3
MQLGLLRRLHTFSLASVSTPVHPEPVTNDPVIRRLALLSQLVVFKDVIPSYRIRSLSDKEKTEKVSQAVMRTREWEQGLVGAYQYYLRGLEAELKGTTAVFMLLCIHTTCAHGGMTGKTELADVALQSMCTLLKEVTHFNFRTNLLSSVIACLSKKSWDEVGFPHPKYMIVFTLTRVVIRAMLDHLDRRLPCRPDRTSVPRSRPAA